MGTRVRTWLGIMLIGMALVLIFGAPKQFIRGQYEGCG